jgi:hypothetical protein
VRCTRLYTAANGHSRFEEVDLPEETRSVVESDLQAAFSEPMAANEVFFRRVVREASAEERHNTPRRQIIVHLSGEAEVETSEGDVRRFGPGDLLLLEDVDGLGHTTRRVSDGERLTLVVTLRGA